MTSPGEWRTCLKFNFAKNRENGQDIERFPLNDYFIVRNMVQALQQGSECLFLGFNHGSVCEWSCLGKALGMCVVYEWLC